MRQKIEVNGNVQQESSERGNKIMELAPEISGKTLYQATAGVWK
jgi:hypothetical protein